MTEGYKGRIGNLIRDARKHRGLTQHQLADLLVHQPERDQPDREGSPEPLPGDARPDRRRARLRDRRARRRPDAPAGHRAHHAVRAASTSRPRRTPASRCCAPRCSTAAAPRCARSPGSRRSTGCSRCSTASASRPAGSTTTTTSRSSRPRTSTSTTSTRPPRGVPARSSCSSARCCTARTSSSCRTPAAATSAPAPSSRTWPRCGPFGLEVKATDGQLPRPGQPGHRAEPPDRAHRARRHRHRERPDGRGAAPRHHRDPQRVVELHGPGPLLLPAEARRHGRGHRHHHADRDRAARDIDVDVDYAPSEDPIEAMSLLAAAIVTQSSITIRRVPIEFLEIELALLEEMGFQYNRSEEYVARNGRTRLVDLTTQALGAARAAGQDPPDAVPGPQHRQPAVLRGDRRGRRGPDPAARLGLREPRDLPHRPEQARRPGQAARPAPGDDRGPDAASPAPRSSARRRCVRPW